MWEGLFALVVLSAVLAVTEKSPGDNLGKMWLAGGETVLLGRHITTS